MQRFTGVPYAFAALVLYLAMNAAVLGQKCHRCGVQSGCPSPTPRLEVPTATTLYWHDPCACVDAPCLSPSCPDMIAPRWYVSAELMPLFRDQVTGVDFQVDGTTGESVLRESLFKSDFAAGAKLVLGTALGDWYRLEGSYLGSHSWEDTLVVRNVDPNPQGSTGNLLSPFSNFGSPAIPGLDFNNFATVDFSSELNSVELNLRRRIPLPANRQHFRVRYADPSSSTLFLNRRATASILLGLRYMRLEEQFGYFTQSDEPPGGSNNQVDMTTENDMIGAQIGFLSQFHIRHKSWLDVEIKGGIFQNRMRLNASYLNTDSAGGLNTQLAGDDRRDHTSWVGELSVMYNHQFAPSLTFRMGYNAVAVVDVALASENFISHAALLSPGPPASWPILASNDGDVVYHGPSLGLVWSR